jgi:hypothetical protein
MKPKSLRCLSALAASFALAAAASPSSAAIFGTLSNFDVVNDTKVGNVGTVCHGFEIELDNITPSQVVYTFGAPYNRYGSPTITASGPNTIVRYAATFNAGAWSASTPFATTPIVTGGHQFWTGGDPNYPALVPGDHFGMSVNGSPTNTIYHWLYDDGTGHLTAAANATSIPVPTWTVAAPVNPAAPAAVRAVIQAPPAPAALFGTPIWVKVFITESTAPADLNHLLVRDPMVPGRDALGNEEAAEVEVEWLLLQKGYADHESLDSGLKDMGAGNEVVSRRYEYYKYVGAFDSDGQALTDSPDLANLSASVGAFIGGQNAAMDLAGIALPEPASATLLLLGVAALLKRRK